MVKQSILVVECEPAEGSFGRIYCAIHRAVFRICKSAGARWKIQSGGKGRDGKQYEQLFQVLPNPAKGLTAQSVAQLYQQGMRLHRLHEKLYVLVDSLDKKIAAATQQAATDSIAKGRL